MRGNGKNAISFYGFRNIEHRNTDFVVGFHGYCIFFVS